MALMTLDTALKAASMQRMPTPKTTEGAPPSAAIAAEGVIRTAGTAAPAISSGVPRSCGGAVPRKAMLRRARQASSPTHPVISLDERAMASRGLTIHSGAGARLRNNVMSTSPQQSTYDSGSDSAPMA